MSTAAMAIGDAWVALWAESLWRASWQGAIFILVVWTVCRLMPRLPAAARCWLWWLASFKLLVGLVWGVPLTVALLPPRQPEPRLPRVSLAPYLPAVAAVARPPVIQPAETSSNARSPRPAPLPAPATTPHTPRQPWLPLPSTALLGVWLAGVAWRLQGATRSWRGARRLVREAHPFDHRWASEQVAQIAVSLRLRQTPRLLASSAASGPLVIGAFKPVVVLPEVLDRPFSALSPEELRMALAHELAHIVRWDLRLALAPDLAQALFFFHPLVGLACREWRLAREAACDAEALRVTQVSSAAYGRLLLKLAATNRWAAGLPALAATTHCNSLRRRLKMLQQSPVTSRRWMRAGLLSLVALGALGILPWRLTALALSKPKNSILQDVKELDTPLTDFDGPVTDTETKIPLSEPVEKATRDNGVTLTTAQEVAEKPLVVASSKSTNSVLQGVKELDTSVTYTETKIPLGELIERVARETGAPLTTAKDVADEPVAVVVKGLPARKLLEQLADLLDYHWSRRNKDGAWRYEIWQDLASKQREEALREAAAGKAVKELQQQARQAAQLAAAPPQQLEAILKAAEQDRAQRRSSLPRPRSVAEMAREREQWQQFNLAERLESPTSRTLAGLLGRLTPEQWTLLGTEGAITYATNSGPGELPLPEEVTRDLKAATPQISASEARTLLPRELGGGPIGLSEQFRRHEREMQEQWSTATGYRVVIQLRGNPQRPGSRLDLIARVTSVGGTGSSSSGVSGGLGTTLDFYATAGDPDDDGLAENTPERRAALEKDPILARKKPFHPTTEPDQVTSLWQSWRLPKLLPDLGQAYGSDFISDSYWSTGAASLSPQPQSAEPRPLYAVLDQYAARQYRWERRDRLIRIRSRRWFLDRPREVPLRLLRHWKALGEERGALPMEEYTANVTPLSDAQLASLPSLVSSVDLPQTLSGVFFARGALRLYAALSPLQCEALWQGQSIPVAQMLPEQRAFFLAALRQQNQVGPPGRDEKRLDLSEWTSGSFSLASERTTITRDPRGDPATLRIERVLPLRSGEGASGPGSAPRLFPGPEGRLLPQPAGARPGNIGAGPAAARVTGAPPTPVKRYPALRVTFSLEYGQDMRETRFLTAAPQP